MGQNDPDFGPYGKGITGYLLYQQSLEDDGGGGGSGGNSGCSWKVWAVIGVIVVILDLVFKCS